MTKQEQIQVIKEQFDKAVEAINERREYRMKNYYDCIDDYSWGGPCDKADDIEEDRLRLKRDILIEQVNGDGAYIRTSSFYRIKDEEGNTATARYGKYGAYFPINDKFVGVPKNIKTLERKGYILEMVQRTYKCVFGHISKNGHLINKSMEMVSEKVVKVETMPDYISEKPFIDYQYDNNF